MRYGIAINFDYENHPYETVRRIFAEVQDAMLSHGFRQDGRVFTIELPAREACELARQVVEEVEAANATETYSYIKEFYGFDFSEPVNLLLPPTDDIRVEELGDMDDLEVIQFRRS